VERQARRNTGAKLVELSPGHFQDSERTRWLNFMQIYTASYVNQKGDREAQRFIDQKRFDSIYNKQTQGGLSS
jgi:hypothetical protein